MKHLWAPWRVEYITGKRQKGCLFCRAFASRKDRANLVLMRTERVFVIMNRYPYNSGHLMVAPITHTGDFSELEPEILLDMMETAVKMKRLLGKVMRPGGYNLGINCGKVGGAGVEDHLHMHVVPRWAGDTNFMHVLADVRVVPQALDALYGDLSHALREMKD